ncbi:unnamed protein product [Linum trigynum]|uniref:Uncharacterized protein n=1 Tax=Linum trigynum TaxID=586398 RepID=A0AAV2DQN9_9ROSI
MALPPGKPEVISREMVRPSTATPDRHRIHHLSFFDQLFPSIYVPLLYFYLNHETRNSIAADVVRDNKTRVLKLSLSEALSTYYPLAGRMGDDDPLTVHCNDEGALFLQARTNSELHAALNHPDAGVRDEFRKLLFPDDLCYKSTSCSRPLAVQVTSFECGGIALGICVSHKFLDMFSFCSFISYWAAIAAASSLGHSNIKLHPLEFTLATLYPPFDLPPPVNKTVVKKPRKDVRYVVNRFVFGASSIAKLKAIVGIGRVENPTRVELVLALLCSCAISAASSSKGRGVVLIQAVNLRRRMMSPPPPARSVGNLSSVFAMSIADDMVEDLALFVSMLRRAKTGYFSSCAAESVGINRFLDFIMKTVKEYRDASKEEEAAAAKVYPCSSWCGFPLYEADFGWGKPVWVTAADFDEATDMVLLDTRDGHGIEAVVSLEEHEMAALLRDQKLLAFARINPVVDPVIIR